MEFLIILRHVIVHMDSVTCERSRVIFVFNRFYFKSSPAYSDILVMNNAEKTST